MDIDEKVDKVLYGKKKKSHKGLLIFLSTFSVILTLILMQILPAFTKLETDEIESIDTNVANSDANVVWHDESGAWNYWNVVGNNFGVTSGRELNDSFILDFYDDHVITQLNASVSGNPGTYTFNASEGLTTFMNWSEENNSAKISWIINTTTAPIPLYYALTFAIDVRCLNYLNGTINNHSVQFDIPFDNETVSFAFNWSDIIPLIQGGQVYVKCGRTTVGNDSYFWFRVFSVDTINPGVVFEIDPTFGHSGGSSLSTLEDQMKGSIFQMGAVGGTADNITVFLSVDTANHKVMCEIYDNITKNLVGYTEEKDLGATYGTVTFDIVWGGSLTADAFYYICAWGEAESGSCTVGYEANASYDLHRDIETYDSSPPDPGDFAQFAASNVFNIYCSYTVSTGWENTAPTNTDFRVNGSVNGSTGIPLYPQLNISTVDVDGNNSKIYWETNASGSWYLYYTNVSCLNDTYYDLNFSNASAYGTKYWVRISINDTHDNTTRVYHFTTEVELAWYVVNNTVNGSWINTTAYHEVQSTINGSWINTTTFKEIQVTINGSWINTTIWREVQDSINGTWINTTLSTWNVVNNTINGSWINTTTYHEIQTTINGSWINLTSFKEVQIDINGSWVNTTAFKEVQTDINGSWINLTIFQEVQTTVNGSWINLTSFKEIQTDINGSWINSTVLAWYETQTGINGSWVNVTTFQDMIILELGITFLVENENYTNNVTLHLSQIKINDTWMMFNSTGFYLYSTNDILIQIIYINSNISGASEGEIVLDFFTNHASGIVWYNISGFPSDTNYTIYRNGTEYTTDTSNSTGNITFSASGGGQRHWTIKPETPAPPNNPPNIANEYPPDTSISILLTPLCSAYITDADGETTTVKFYNSTDGITYNIQQTNNTVPSGTTVRWRYTQATGYNTMYYWRATANDGEDTTTENYYFTTYESAENWPTITNETPTNQSIEQNLTINWTVYIADPNGDAINWTINCSNGQNNSADLDTNGTKNVSLTGLTEYTTYIVYVNVTDGTNWVRKWYIFTTVLITFYGRFTYVVKGGMVTITPTLQGVTHYRWTVVNETGVKGITPWIPVEDICDYILGFVYPTTIRVTLSIKNVVVDRIGKDYSEKITIYKSSYKKPEPVVEEPPVEPTNIFKDIYDTIRKWFGERNAGEILFMIVMSIILAIAIIMKKYPKKRVIFTVLKKKKKE